MPELETAPLTSDVLVELSEVVGRELTLQEVIDIVSEKTQRGGNLAFAGKQRANAARIV
ncbi:hypothetical protein [Arthrobacter sp. SW1]|uniref:hypothetical protein n=1 Tax=Arthrobacter sp. SW1 TaxID=1920889 RepID=UPI001495FC37|nr:hypothetical protein [Arthrobacter sp. SW1]